MVTKLSTWNWGITPNNVAFVEGAMALNTGLIADGRMANIYLSLVDRNGVGTIDKLQSIGLSTIITLDSKPPSADSHWNLEFSVSGIPYYSDEYLGSPTIGHYVVPVTLKRIIPEGNFGVSWDNTAGEAIDVYAPPQTVTPPLVSYAYEPATSLGTSSIEEYTSKSSRWDTREGDIRKQIYRMTQTESNISFIYKESLRSMIASFNDIGYINSDNKLIGTKCIHANAERAIAKLKQENNTILPVLSIAQTVSEDDDKRRRNESVLVHDKYWDDDKKRAIRILSLAPRPVTVKYSLHIWAKYMSNMDQILEQIRLKFNPEMQVPTKYSTIAKALIVSEEDMGKIEAADKEDRILKKTLNITLRTYIPSPKFMLTSTGKIEKFLVDAALL